MTGQYTPGQGFASNPRLAMAQALMARGASTDPVRSPLEGIARALTGGVGGLFAGNARADQQKALSDALAALNDPNVPADQRMNKAIEAAGDSPFADQLRGIAVSKMLPKDPVKLGQHDRLVDPTTGKETVAAAPDLPQGFRLNPQSGAVEVMPGFVPAISGLKKAEAGATAQGAADVRLAMEPLQIAAETAPKARQAAAIASAENPALIARTGGQAQATANVDLAMKPRIAGATTAATQAAEAPFVQPRAAAQQAGTIAGQMTPVATPEGPVPGIQAVKAAEGAGTPKQMTEKQAAAVLFLGRAVPSHEMVNGLDSKVMTDIAQKGMSSIPIAGNFLTSDETKKFNNAKLNFITAVLRPESGATIQPSEYSDAERLYFPVPGDPPVIIQQKQQAREQEIAGLKLMASGQIPFEYGGAKPSERLAAMQSGQAAVVAGGQPGAVPPGNTKPPLVSPSPVPGREVAPGMPAQAGPPRKVVVQNGMRFDADTHEYLGQAQ